MRTRYGIMRRIFSAAAVVIVFTAHTQGQTQMLKEGVVSVLVSPGYTLDDLRTNSNINGRSSVTLNHSKLKKVFGNYSITKLERTYPGVEKYNHPNVEILKRYYTIEGNFKRDRVMRDVINEGDDFFQDVEPQTNVQLLYVPNDYSIEPNGSSHLDLVNAKGAWDVTKGSRSVSVAVTDPTGFYYNHPDYVAADGTNQVIYSSPSAADQSSFTEFAHGLMVASAVAAATDNATGISGLGFNTRLMTFGGGLSEMLSASYDHGANIVEASWIGSCTYSSSEQLIIDMIHDNGTVIVVAAGNGNAGAGCASADGQNNGLTYPSAYDHVISVGGVSSSDEYFRANGNHLTFNEDVDLTAQGWSVPVMSALKSTSGVLLGYEYSLSSGTSFAAPQVAGLSGLILSLDETLPPIAVERIMKNTAVNIDGVTGNAPYAGNAGAGRIDAAAAVTLANTCFACEQTLTLPILGSLPASASNCKILVQGGTLAANASLTYTASRQLMLKPGFKASTGSTAVFQITNACSSLLAPESSGNGRKADPRVSYKDLIISGVIEIPEDVVGSTEYSGTVSYPNPTRDQVVFMYSLKQSSTVNLTVHDISGNLVDVLVEDQYQDEGEHRVSYDVSGLKAGVYYYTIVTSYSKETQRLVVVH